MSLFQKIISDVGFGYNKKSKLFFAESGRFLQSYINRGSVATKFDSKP